MEEFLQKAMDTQKLQKRIRDTQEQLERDRKAREYWEARDKLIDEAPDKIRTDFWCGTCDEDILNCRAYKVVQRDWTAPGQRIAFYESYQACHRIRRFITDKNQDPYFRKSEMLRRQRIDQAADLLQPGDPGFNMKYGDPNKRLYEKMEAEERANYYNEKV